ncbi:MAG: phenylalanine--tRNA ligase subunit alpha, partial [Parasporobacterium sp.]|nr:phenylalanine--tRNA ligase subunit alpha [Parasporobacterium sp.]
MKEKLAKIRQEALEKITGAGSVEALNELKVLYLGKKGQLTEVLKGMKNVSAEERPVIGQLVNDARNEIEGRLDSMKQEFENRIMEARLKAEALDVTLPGKKQNLGHNHPNSMILKEVEDIFVGMGYEVVSGPEVEYDYYNFEALNIPANHPAKDEQDTFYI